jgi:hypothetical protein
MAASAAGTDPSTVREQIAAEREQLADAVADLKATLRPSTPLLAVAAFGAAFLLAGGVGATMRLLARRGREGREKARAGRFALVSRD